MVRWIIWTLCMLGLPWCGVAHGSEAQYPSMEMLEFLGSFESTGKGWVDPVQLDELSEAERPRKPAAGKKGDQRKPPAGTGTKKNEESHE